MNLNFETGQLLLLLLVMNSTKVYENDLQESKQNESQFTLLTIMNNLWMAGKEVIMTTKSFHFASKTDIWAPAL